MKEIKEKILKQLVTFQSVEAMDAAVKKYKKQFHLGDTDQAILFVISQYACKYPGVCYLSKAKIAENAGFESRRTAIRSCLRLEEAGIIKQYETRRMSGDKRRSVNIIVIQDLNVAEESPQADTTPCHDKEALLKTTFKTKKMDILSRGTEEGNQQLNQVSEEVFFKTGLKHSIPQAYYEAFSVFFSAKEMYEIYGVLLRARNAGRPLFMIDHYAADYVEQFYNVIRLYKWGKVQNLKAYLYESWRSLTEALNRKWTIEQGEVKAVYMIEEMMARVRGEEVDDLEN